MTRGDHLKVKDNVFQAKDLLALRNIALNHRATRRAPQYKVIDLSKKVRQHPSLCNVLTAANRLVPQDAQFREGWFIAYDTHCDGVPLHADRGYITVNIWLTPNSCMLSSKNGLIIWDAMVPDEWEFEQYNTLEPTTAMQRLTQNAHFRVIPYAFNRAVVFKSKLLHCTNGVCTKEGKENQRVNLTLMYDKKR